MANASVAGTGPVIQLDEIDLLVFDLDGTLVDTRQDLAHAVNFALAHFGKDHFSHESIVGFVGDGIVKLIERALGEEGTPNVEEALRLFRSYYGEHISDYSQPYHGVIDLLEALTHKKKAVLTNKPHVFSEPLLRDLKMRDYFDVTIGGHNGYPLKPDPAALIEILQRFEVSPERAIMIGDSQNDVLAGQAASMHTCAVTYGFRPEEELLALNPTIVARSPIEILSLLR